MKSTALLAAAVLSFASLAASAQTGRPSEAPSDRPVAASTDDAGSYAHYLMLNGKPRDVAVAEAQNVDHPAPSKHFALHVARQAGAVTSTQR